MNHFDQEKLSPRSVIALRTADARIFVFQRLHLDFQAADFTKPCVGTLKKHSKGTDGAESKGNRVLVRRVSKSPEGVCLPRHIRRRCQRERADDGQAGRIVKLVKQSREEWVDYAAC